jgi:predicted GIY-YIG superfamily endonuclease
MPVYLLHFNKPYAHARHYCGFAESDVEARVAEHRAGRGARLCAVAVSAGIELELVQVWPEGDRRFERKLKDGSLTTLCPLCRPAALARKRERNQRIKFGAPVAG